MTENQKLRDALQEFIDAFDSEDQTFDALAWVERARQALALPTAAPAVPQGWPLGELSNGQIIATVGRMGELVNYLKLGQQWDGICNLVRQIIRERYTLAATPAPAPAQEPAKETFQSRHEREFMERMAGNHGKLTEFCAALESFTHDYQRLYSTYKSYRDMISDLIKERDSLRDQVAKPAQEVGLTEGEIQALGHRIATTYRHDEDGFRRQYAFNIYTLVDFANAIIAALRAKGGK